MINIIKMDLYRFFRLSSIGKILFTDLILTFLSIMLVYTTPKSSPSIQVYSNALELLAAQINGGILMILCTVSTILFVSAKYRDGFIKNVAYLMPYRVMLIFPEIIVIAVVCGVHFVIYSFSTIGMWSILLGNACYDFSILVIIKFFAIQFVLHWGLCCLLLLFYMLIGSTAFTILFGFLIAFRVCNRLYFFLEYFVSFNIGLYMLDTNIFQIGLDYTQESYKRAFFVGILFLLGVIPLLCLVLHKKDID